MILKALLMDLIAKQFQFAGLVTIVTKEYLVKDILVAKRPYPRATKLVFNVALDGKIGTVGALTLMLEERSKEVYEVKVGPPEVDRFLDLRPQSNPFLLNRCHINDLIVRLVCIYSLAIYKIKRVKIRILTIKNSISSPLPNLLLNHSSTYSEFFMHKSKPLRNSQLFAPQIAKMKLYRE